MTRITSFHFYVFASVSVFHQLVVFHAFPSWVLRLVYFVLWQHRDAFPLNYITKPIKGRCNLHQRIQRENYQLKSKIRFDRVKLDIDLKDYTFPKTSDKKDVINWLVNDTWSHGKHVVKCQFRRFCNIHQITLSFFKNSRKHKNIDGSILVFVSKVCALTRLQYWQSLPYHFLSTKLKTFSARFNKIFVLLWKRRMCFSLKGEE